MDLSKWRVTVFGVAGTEFTYEVEAATESEALEKTYGSHGRRLRSGEVTEALGARAMVAHVGHGEVDAG